jgi:inositol transport system substrate-binding protein
MKKKILAICLSAMLAVGLSACGAASNDSNASSNNSTSENTSEESSASESTSDESSASSAENSSDASTDGAGIKLGVCLPFRDQYLTTFETGVVRAAEAKGIDCQVAEAQSDISRQIGQIETFRNNGFTAIAVALVSAESYQEAIDAAGDMDVIFFNRKVDESCLDGTKTIYVGMAEYDAGYAQGTWLAEYYKENEPDKTDLKGIMFMGILGEPSVTDRTQGAKDALADAGYNVEWVFEDTAEWDRAKAMDKFTQFYGSDTDFDFVCSNNDEMALGVIEACSAMGVAVDFPIVGIDATEAGCQGIESGNLKMTVNQNGIMQGEIVAQCVIDMANDTVPEGCDENYVYSTEAQAVTTDNVSEVLDVFNNL